MTEQQKPSSIFHHRLAKAGSHLNGTLGVLLVFGVAFLSAYLLYTQGGATPH